ncbi:MAG: hypothetical protein JWR69_4669, partial [Pedosphaera sp.]|nr:hypothetical protein [Pedosphaera sp.]
QGVGTILNDDGLPGLVDHFSWNVIASPQAAGVPFTTTIAAKDVLNATVTNFSGAVALSGSADGGTKTNMILGNLVATGSGSGTYTLAFPFTPNTNIVVTHLRSYSGTKVSIWQTNGTLLASQIVSSVAGTWVETPLATPLSLAAGSTYLVGFYTAGGSYYWRTDMTNSFPDGTLVNGYYSISADAFPTTFSAGTAVYLVDLRYTVNAGAPLLVTPAAAGPFTNGVWTGSLAVQPPATNAVLRADDGNGHAGGSSPFDVLLQDDISIAMADAPDPVSVGASLTYTLTVANAGPAAATGVTVTNLLPPGVTFVSATGSQGTCTQSAGVVSCGLGSLPGGSNAVITIVVVPMTSGVILTNTATVVRAEADPYLGNNLATAATTVTPPAISIADAAVPEGNVGTTNLVFAVTLAAPSAQTITVNYATTGGTAAAGIDYVSTNGILTFAPGVTNQSLVVRVLGDVLIETNETFFATLSNPVNSVLGRSQGAGTILNDDGLPGQVDHFVWNTIPSPQVTNYPFTTTITVLDAANAVVTNFTGLVNFTTTPASVLINPVVSGVFSNGLWSGNLAIQSVATNLVLRANDGDGHVGLSNPFHIIISNQPPVIIASPTNTVAYLGRSATFQANVLAWPPLFYQWRFNGADILGATNATLLLDRVSLNQAGSYSVAVSNAFGVVSSAKAVLSVMQVVAWGAGTNGILSQPNYAQSVVPPGMTNVVGLAGGLYHSIALRANGQVAAWGAGTNNLLQLPYYGQSIVPPIGSVVAVAGGGYHTLALRGDGTIAAWGAGTNNLQSSPYYGQSIIPSAATNIIAIAAGDYHSVALRSDGKVLAWGYSSFGQTNVPTAATSNVVAIASRSSHVLALKSDGSLVHWGSLTTLPAGVSNIVTIAAGVNHCLA